MYDKCINNFIVKQDSLSDEMKKHMHFFIIDFFDLLPTALVDKILEEPQFAVCKRYCTGSLPGRNGLRSLLAVPQGFPVDRDKTR